MQSLRRPRQFSAPSLSLVLLTGLLIVLWLAGGSSRADALGQAVVRGTAWLALIAAILLARPPSFREVWPALLLLIAALALVLVQLVPLPPAVWLGLPGRAPLAQAATAIGEAQPWRPLAIVPDAAWNAASSLVVPFAVLILMAGLQPRDRSWLLGIVLGLVAASALLALLQFSGAATANPFINDRAGMVSGSLANRNHFALFTAVGCLLVPAWAFLDGRAPHWRGPVAISLTLLFALVILASGSRAGIFIGVLALIFGGLLARHGLRRAARRAPRWALAVGVGLLLVATASFVLISVAAGRAPSIERAFAADTGDDMRLRALPTLLTMARTYFPAGGGFGGFDPLFRMHEPFGLLKQTYFNHAHNDLLEVIIEGGLAALLLLLAALAWWIRASVRAWGRDAPLAQLGSAIILLVLVASAFDYPVRTPIIMAVLAIAAAWLNASATRTSSAALPSYGR